MLESRSKAQKTWILV